MIPEPAARRYAEAAFLLAKDGGNADAWSSGLQGISTLFGNEDAARFFANTSVSPDAKRQLVEKNVGSRDLGMDGTWVIHPQQAEIANEVFTPDAEQIAKTKRSLEVYHKLGGGSIADPETGEFYDEATTKAMLMDLAKAVQAGTLDEGWLREMAAKSKEVSGYDILEVMGRVA